MLSRNKRNAIDAYLLRSGINLAAMLRAEKSGYNLDTLRLEIIRKLRGSSSKQRTDTPKNFVKKANKLSNSMMQP